MLTSLSASAQFSFVPKASLDYYPKHSIKITQGNLLNTIYSYSPISMQIGGELKYKNLASVYIHQQVFMKPKAINKYQPTLAKWFFGCTLKIIDNLHLKYEHLCIHQIKTDLPSDNVGLFGGYDKISLSYNM